MRNDSDKRHEAHKFADDAVRAREDEEGHGRLRMALFWAAVGPMACIAIKFLDLTPPKLAVHGILATIPLSIVILLVAWVRVPTRLKLTGQTLMVALMTLAATGATFFLYHQFSLSRFAKAS
jgi:hypothetical protein